jgi:hypothetical protein
MTEATRWWIRFRASPVGKIFSSLHVATKRKRLLPLFFFATEDNFTTYDDVEDDQRSLNGTNFIPTMCVPQKKSSPIRYQTEDPNCQI